MLALFLWEPRKKTWPNIKQLQRHISVPARMHQSWERNDPIHLIQGADREARGSGFYRCTFPALPSCPRCYLNPLPTSSQTCPSSALRRRKEKAKGSPKKRRPCKFLCSYRAVISFCFPLKNQVSPYRFLTKINSCFLKSISEVESRGGGKKKIKIRRGGKLKSPICQAAF